MLPNYQGRDKIEMLKKFKNTKKFRSLKVTLALAFLALIAVVLIVSSSLNIYFRLQTQEKIIANQQQLIIQEAANAVRNFILEKFSELEGGVRLGDLGIASREEQKLVLEKLIGVEPAFRQLVLLNTQGRELLNVSRLSSFASNQLAELIGDDLFLTTSKEKRYIGPVYIDNLTSEPLVVIAVPITDVFGDFKGVIMAEVNLKFMWNLVDTIKVGDTGVAYVVNKGGNLIAFGDTSRVLKGENLAYLDEVKEFMEGNESVTKSMPKISKGIRGDDVVTSHVVLGNPDWAVVVELPVEEAYEDVNLEIRISVFIMFLCFVSAIVISIYFSGKISKPIIKLRDATNKIGEGNLDGNIETLANNEIGQLADDFNLMTNNLKKSKNELLGAQKNLEIKVEERTRELNEKVIELKQNETATLNIMDDLQKTLEELKQSHFVIEEQNVQLQKLNKIKSNFLNITSHELRTPMAAVKGYIQMMLKGNLGTISDEQKKVLDIILRNSNRLERLIQDILDISRLESGTMKFIIKKTDIIKMVNEVAETMQVSADLKGIKINTEIGSDIPELTIDKDRITQVVVNLVNNAIKFSPNDSKIVIKARMEKEDVLFEVQDCGRGIPKEHHKKIFQSFYQVDSDADTKFGGAGLGLAICYGIVFAHGGHIWVESTGKPGEGSTFRFTLPVESVVNIEERFKGADVFGLEKE